jgi:hypothetical protein
MTCERIGVGCVWEKNREGEGVDADSAPRSASTCVGARAGLPKACFGRTGDAPGASCCEATAALCRFCVASC